MRINIVSGTDRPLLRSEVNHQRYAERHGYGYAFDAEVYPNLPTPHFRKLCSVYSALDQSDWVFWLDDDAYFTNMTVRLEEFLKNISDEVFLVICSSPVNPQGGWTYLSSGQFFIRNNIQAREFLGKVMATPVETARDWWDSSRYGMFTNGDQDSIVYVLATENLLRFTKIFSYEAFNARPYHYKERLDEYFLVHFPGVPDKQAAIAAFGGRFGADETLVRRDDRGAKSPSAIVRV